MRTKKAAHHMGGLKYEGASYPNKPGFVSNKSLEKE